MSAGDTRPFGAAGTVQPHAYDPIEHPERFDGVAARRVVAFVIDFIILSIPVLFAAMFIFVIGIVTLGFGFLFYLLLWPGMVAWAIVYYGMTLGGPASATLGMRMMDLQMRTWYGAPSYFLLGAGHAVLFWISVSAITPLILLVAFFNHRRRCLHDMLLGTIIINNDSRAASLRARGDLAT